MKMIPEREAETSMRKVELIHFLSSVLVYVEYVDHGSRKPDTKSKVRGTRNKLTRFWNCHEFTLFVKDSV